MSTFRPLAETKFINDANLVSYWKLDGNSNDSKGSNNGTDTSMSYSAGIFNNAGVFNGSSSKIVIGNNLGITSGNISYSSWVKISSQPSDGSLYCVFTQANTTSNVEYKTRYRNIGGTYILNFIRTRRGVVDNEFSINYTLALDTWYLITTTYDGTNLNGYVNGTYLGQIASSGNGTSGATNNSSIGFYVFGGVGSEWYWNGSIDDTAIFSRALSSAEVNELYQGMTLGEYLPNSNTKLLLHLNGSSVDSSGQGNNGTDTAITYSQANGKFGQGAGVNGSSSKIVLNNSLITALPITISSWINFTANGGIVGSVTGGISFKTGGSPSKLYLEVSGTATIGNSVTTITSGWKHVAVTYDTSGNYKFYLNGALDGSGTNLQSFTTQVKSIGLNGTTEFFNGSIDEVIIENYAWTPEQVKKYYTMTKGRFGII